MSIKTMKEILLQDREDDPGREEWKIAECEEKRVIRDTFDHMDKCNYSCELINTTVRKMKYTTKSDEVKHYIDILYEWIRDKKCQKVRKKGY